MDGVGVVEVAPPIGLAVGDVPLQTINVVGATADPSLAIGQNSIGDIPLQPISVVGPPLEPPVLVGSARSA